MRCEGVLAKVTLINAISKRYVHFLKFHNPKIFQSIEESSFLKTLSMFLQLLLGLRCSKLLKSKEG